MGPRSPSASLDAALELVMSVLTGFGIDPESARAAPGDAVPGKVAFALTRGSAEVVVALHPPKGGKPDGTLRVVSPVVRIPESAQRLALFERVLTANARELVGAAFALAPPDLVLVAERSVRDLDASEVQHMIEVVGRAADRFDDELATEFGVTRSSDAALTDPSSTGAGSTDSPSTDASSSES